MSRIIEAGRRILPARQVQSLDEFIELTQGARKIKVQKKVILPYEYGSPEFICFRKIEAVAENGRRVLIRGNNHIEVDYSESMAKQQERAELRLDATVGKEIARLTENGLPIPRVVGERRNNLGVILHMKRCASDQNIRPIALNNGNIFARP
ncbi:hypothetical protein M1349_03960 [Patescibacteria group bacterium]|nr:hypothetical protein [Patescibacteria group bacterium]